MRKQLAKLFQQGKIGTVEVRNRMVMAPMAGESRSYSVERRYDRRQSNTGETTTTPSGGFFAPLEHTKVFGSKVSHFC
jgi:ABC-type uncharacterized transport system ATPase component